MVTCDLSVNKLDPEIGNNLKSRTPKKFSFQLCRESDSVSYVCHILNSNLTNSSKKKTLFNEYIHSVDVF